MNQQVLYILLHSARQWRQDSDLNLRSIDAQISTVSVEHAELQNKKQNTNKTLKHAKTQQLTTTTYGDNKAFQSITLIRS